MFNEIPENILKQINNLNRKDKFNIFYNLATGLFDLKKLTGLEKELSFYVKDELSGFGVCHKLYNKFENMMREVHDMEYDLRKNDFFGTNLASRITIFVDDYSKNLSRKLFEYGIQIGSYALNDKNFE